MQTGAKDNHASIHLPHERTYQCSYVFDVPPKDYNPLIEVAAVFIQVGNKVLFVKRHPEISKGNTWAIPGGKIESKRNESPLNAALRELREETGLTLDSLEVLQTVYIREPKLDYTYHMFRVALDVRPSITLNPLESVDFKWLTRDEVNTLNTQNLLILDEMPCIQRVYGNGAFI